MGYMGIRILSRWYLTKVYKYARLFVESSISSEPGPFVLPQPQTCTFLTFLCIVHIACRYNPKGVKNHENGNTTTRYGLRWHHGIHTADD